MHLLLLAMHLLLLASLKDRGTRSPDSREQGLVASSLRSICSISTCEKCRESYTFRGRLPKQRAGWCNAYIALTRDFRNKDSI